MNTLAVTLWFYIGMGVICAGITWQAIRLAQKSRAEGPHQCDDPDCTYEQERRDRVAALAEVNQAKHKIGLKIVVVPVLIGLVWPLMMIMYLSSRPKKGAS